MTEIALRRWLPPMHHVEIECQRQPVSDLSPAMRLISVCTRLWQPRAEPRGQEIEEALSSAEVSVTNWPRSNSYPLGTPPAQISEPVRRSILPRDKGRDRVVAKL